MKKRKIVSSQTKVKIGRRAIIGQHPSGDISKIFTEHRQCCQHPELTRLEKGEKIVTCKRCGKKQILATNPIKPKG